MSNQGAPAVKTVLAAMDFSENAARALDWAQDLARVHNARLVLFHAVAPPIGPAAVPEFVNLPPDIYEQQKECSRELLNEEVAKRRRSGVEIEARMEVGPSGPAIIDAAVEENADLVVVGTRGLTGLKRTFLGSVAARLIRDAPCPVLAVPATEEDVHRPVRRVLAPTDFSGDSGLAVETTIRMLGPVSEGMKVTLLHVWRVPVILSPWGTFPIERIRRQTANDAQRKLEEIATPLRDAGFDVETTECEGEPADAIDQEASRIGADLIAMGTHGRSGISRVFFGSVAERTLPTAPCPVLTVHRTEEATPGRPFSERPPA